MMTETASADSEGDSSKGDGYGGVFGAFPYAFRQSDSLLFRSYAIVGGLMALLLSLLFLFALIGQVASTLGGPGGSFTFSRALFILVGLLIVAPVMAPVLFVARHHRLVGDDIRYDRLLGGVGFAFLASLYLGITASVPPELARPTPTGFTGPLVELLYNVPDVVAFLIPTVTGLSIYVVHRLAR
jgi:hypothetical protein